VLTESVTAIILKSDSWKTEENDMKYELYVNHELFGVYDTEQDAINDGEIYDPNHYWIEEV
jgi:hypothetical protein